MIGVAEASVDNSAPRELSLYSTPDQAAERVARVWTPLLLANPIQVKPRLHNRDVDCELWDLKRAVRAMPTSHAAVILPWIEKSGALNNFSSINELNSLIDYLSSYPLDSFRHVSSFVQEAGLLPKCGLQNQLEYIYRFAKSYSEEDLKCLQQIFAEGRVFDKLLTGEQAAYLLKDMIQDRDSEHASSSIYPLSKLREVVKFLHGAGIIGMCRDGVVLRDIIASLKYFDLTVLSNPRKPLPSGSYFEFALALRYTPFWDNRFEAYVAKRFRESAQAAEAVERVIGAESPLTLDYYKQALEAEMEALISCVTYEPKLAETLRQKMTHSLVGVHNLAAAKHLRGFYSKLRSTNSHYLKHVIPTMLEIVDKGIYLDQEGFERVQANICCIPKYTYAILQPLIMDENLIELCSSKTDLIRLFLGFSNFSEKEAHGLVTWFRDNQIRKRLVRYNDLCDVLVHLQILLEKGAVFSEGKLDVSKVHGSEQILKNALNFLEVEKLFSLHGDQSVYSPAFGDVLVSYFENEYFNSLLGSGVSDLPMSRNRTNSDSSSARHPPITIVSNNQGHKGVDETIITRPEDTMLQGKAFIDLIPTVEGRPEEVGYNVCLPNGEIKAVCVEVYGGFGTLKEAYFPGHIGYRESYLLSKGIACISLNLPDLLRLNVFQDKMSKELHSSLQACIYAFFTILKDRPEQLHAELARLKHIPLYLYGASFGGRTVFYYSQLHPNTFDGYISHDGQFSYGQPHLSAVNEQRVAKISPRDSFLLLQNFDDQCVNSSQTPYMFEKLKSRSAPVTLLISDRGNPVPRKKQLQRCPGDFEELRDHPIYKGHFMPQQRHLYVRTIHDFIVHGVSAEHALSEWRLLRYNAYCMRPYSLRGFLGDIDSMERLAHSLFMSEASRLYRSSLLANPTGMLDPASIRHPASQEQAWTTFYEPLLRASTYFKSLSLKGEIEAYSIPDDHLTDENIDRALCWLLPVFVDHLYETETAFSSLGLDSLKLHHEVKNIISPALRQAFREKMQSKSPSDRHEVLLNCWILSNPQLAPMANPLLSDKGLREAKAEFMRFIKVDCGLRKATFRKKVLDIARLIKSQNPEALEVYANLHGN